MVHRIYITISDFLKRFRINVATVIDGRHEIAQPVYDEEGRGSVEHVGERKTAVAKVKVTKPGSGEFVIRHVDYMDIENDITYFFECVYVSKLYIIIIQLSICEIKYTMKKIDFHEKKESFVYTYIIIFHHSYVDRHACMYPLQLTKLLGQVDVECLGKMHEQCRFTVTISFLKCPQSMLDTLYYYLHDYRLLNYLSISLFFSWFWRIYWTS